MKNFDYIVENESIDGFVGFDDGYYANYPCMKSGYSFAYAASFGNAHFSNSNYLILDQRLASFKAIGLREDKMFSYVKNHVNVPVERVLNPTLLLEVSTYDQLAEHRLEQKNICFFIPEDIIQK